MPGRAPRRRRPAVVALAAVALAAAAPGPWSGVAAPWGVAVARAQDGGRGGLLVTVDGRPATDLQAGDVVAAADVTSATEYTERTTPGSRGLGRLFPGTSAGEVATLAGAPPENVATMEVANPSGSASDELSGAEVEDGFRRDPIGSPRFAVFQNLTSDATSGFRMFRPVRTAEGTSGSIGGQNDDTLRIAIVTRNGTVDVDVDAPSRVDVDAGAALRASVPGGSGTPEVAWRFGDGETATAASVTHRFTTAGTYRVRATVTLPDRRSGVGVATITVGSPEETPDPAATTPTPGADGAGGTPGAGTGGSGAPAAGPTAGDGSAAGAAPAAPSDGSAPAPKDPGADRTPVDRPRGDRSTDAPDDANRAGRTSPPAPTPTPATPSAAPSTPTPEAAPEGRAAEAQATRRAARRAERSGTSRAAPPGTISGVLVASRAAAVIPISPAEVARAAAARRGADPRGTSDLAWILGPLVVVGLLGAGALRELRPRRRTLPANRMPT